MIELHPLPADLEIAEQQTDLSLPVAMAHLVDSAWDEACQEHPGLQDGALFSLEVRDGSTLRGRFVPYRFWIAQRVRPQLFDALRVQPLAVTGLTRTDEGWLLGQRAGDTEDGARWELVPAGGLGVEARTPDNTLSPILQLGIELEDELNLDPALVSRAAPHLLIEDRGEHVWDLVYDVHVAMEWSDIQDAFRERTNQDVVALRCVPPEEMDAFLAEIGDALAPLSRQILEARPTE